MTNNSEVKNVWHGAIAAWSIYLKGLGTAPNTISLRSYQVSRLARAYKDISPLEISPADLINWFGSQDWSNSTRRSYRSAIRIFFAWLHQTGQRADNPAQILRPVKIPPGVPRPADEVTVTRIIRHPDERIKLMGLLAAGHGLRACEIAKVHKRDFYEGLDGFHLLLVHGKGGKKRSIPAHEKLVKLVENIDGYLFPGNIDGHLSAKWVSKLLSREMPDGITAHMLRHRAAGVYYESTGWDLRATQTILGHASPVTTQIYTPAVPAQMRKAIAAAA